MLYNQTYNLDQVAFAAEGLKDAQQTVCLQSYLTKTLIFVATFPSRILQAYIQVLFIGQMTAMKAANKELKGMMKTVKLEDIDVCYLPFSRLTLTRFLMLSVFTPYMHFHFVAYFPV